MQSEMKKSPEPTGAVDDELQERLRILRTTEGPFLSRESLETPPVSSTDPLGPTSS